MKFRTAIASISAALTLAPILAQADDTAPIQRCMDTFAAQNFPNRPVAFVVADTATIPLVAREGTRTVQLVARAKSSGRVLANVTCNVKQRAKEPTVTVLPVDL